MKEKIRQRALELGFDDCRFTTADAPGAMVRLSMERPDTACGNAPLIEARIASAIADDVHNGVALIRPSVQVLPQPHRDR